MLLTVKDGSREAQLPILYRRLGMRYMLASAYPYGHISGDNELFWSAYNEISHTLRSQAVIRLEIAVCANDAQNLPAEGKRRLRHALDAIRHVLDLRNIDPENFERSFEPNIRWSLRKAMKNGVEIRQADIEDAAVIQELYARTMKAKHAPVNYGLQRWEGLLANLKPTGAGHIFLAHRDGAPLGMAAVVDGAISRHLIQLAVPPEAQHTRVGELLVAHSIRHAVQSGKQHFDFMASPASDTGLIAYKAKWGSRPEPVQHAVLATNPLLAPAIDVGRWINRIGARLHA